MSIRWKIILPFLVGGIVIVAIFYSYILPHVLEAESKTIREREDILLKSVEPALIENLATENLSALSVNVQSLLRVNKGLWTDVIIHNHENRQVYPATSTSVADEENLLVLTRQLQWDDEKYFGTVTVKLDIASRLQQRSDQYHRFMVIGFGMMILSAITVIFWIDQSLRIPLFRLQQASQQMAEGDFDGAVPAAGKDEIGRLSESFIMMRDSLRNSQERLQKALDDSTESEIRHNVALDSISEAFITLDYQGRIIGANTSCEKMFGSDIAMLRGSKIDSLLNFGDSISDKLKLNDSSVVGVTLECEAVTASNNNFIAEFVINEMWIYGDKNYVVTLRDITERKKTESELLAAKEVAENASRAKDEFLARMSHELRTPLNAILGFAQIMSMDELIKDHQVHKENVAEIMQAGKHLLHLIEEILDLTRIESGKISIVPIELDCQEIIYDCVALLSPLASKKEINVVNRINQSTPVVADYSRLKQVIINLLNNAIKYNKQGGQIEIYTHEPDEDYCRISIKDTGIGFDQSDSERIFLPFERAVAFADEIEGSGIGLALSKRIMDSMHGRIGCESQPGIGSCFWIDVKLHYPEHIQQAC